MERNFGEMLKAQWDRGNFVCVGLDSEYEKIPQAARKEHVDETIFEFNRAWAALQKACGDSIVE